MQPIAFNAAYKAHPDVVARHIAGEVILVPVKGRMADMRQIFSLNAVGVYVWERLDGRATLSEILNAMTGDFEVSPEAAEADIREFVGSLLEAGIIEPSS